MIELKPCPFCGGKAVLSEKYTIQGVDVDAWAVCCGITPSDFSAGRRFSAGISVGGRRMIDKSMRKATAERYGNLIVIHRASNADKEH